MDYLKFAGISSIDKLGEIGNEKRKEKFPIEGNIAIEEEKDIPEDIGNKIEPETELSENTGNVMLPTKGEELDELINNIDLKMNKNDLIKLWEEVKPFTKNESLIDNLAKNNQDKALDLKKILGIALSHERDYDPRYNQHVDSTMESIMKGLRGIYFSIENSINKFKGKYAGYIVSFNSIKDRLREMILSYFRVGAFGPDFDTLVREYLTAELTGISQKGIGPNKIKDINDMIGTFKS